MNSLSVFRRSSRFGFLFSTGLLSYLDRLLLSKSLERDLPLLDLLSSFDLYFVLFLVEEAEEAIKLVRKSLNYLSFLVYPC